MLTLIPAELASGLILNLACPMGLFPLPVMISCLTSVELAILLNHFSCSLFCTLCGLKEYLKETGSFFRLNKKSLSPSLTALIFIKYIAFKNFFSGFYIPFCFFSQYCIKKFWLQPFFCFS